jgi:hypothetical protein
MHAYTVHIYIHASLGDGIHSLGTGISNVIVIPPPKKTMDDFFELAPETWVTLV